MPLVRDIRISVDDYGTRARATFTQLYEGRWQFASLDFRRPIGARAWKPIIGDQDILSQVKTAVTREINARHGTVPAGGVQRKFTTPTHERILPRINAPADVVMRGADAPPVTRVKPRVSRVTPKPVRRLPSSCDCKRHSNGFVKGSPRWMAHALTYQCVGA